MITAHTLLELLPALPAGGVRGSSGIAGGAAGGICRGINDTGLKVVDYEHAFAWRPGTRSVVEGTLTLVDETLHRVEALPVTEERP